jgi:hypothetical protein
MRAWKLVVAVLALVLAAATVAAPPASAHGRIAKGEYPCYTYNSSFQKVSTGYSFFVRAHGRYAFVNVGHWVRQGTFVHPRRGPGLRFTHGYLHKAARGYHMYKRSLGMNVIEILWNHPRDGADYFDCFQ